MSELLPTVSIYRNGEEPFLLLMHYAPLFDERGAYRGDGCWGDLESIAVERFQGEGLNLVRRSFNEFAKRSRRFGPEDKQGFDLWPSSKRRRFFLMHSDVGVTQTLEGDFCIEPMQPSTLGASGASDESLRIIVPQTCTPAEFCTRILAALKL